jgi:hypothetical protein
MANVVIETARPLSTSQGKLIASVMAALADYAKRAIMQSRSTEVVMWPCCR